MAKKRKLTAEQKRHRAKLSGTNMEDATFHRKFKGRAPSALDFVRIRPWNHAAHAAATSDQ